MTVAIYAGPYGAFEKGLKTLSREIEDQLF